MSYQVLARKYRSATFEQLVGQEAIATTLVNAIRTGRVHHGYLFTGTRGVGKTSAARILAKALNCLSSDGPTAAPCCACDACSLIAEGEDLDVVEIDAASNTGVDNIRELRNNTAFRPTRSRFKIYIIDEVHMLSTGAFNALLKTLEEPPEHVKFILATTELQKVPATIQSRCQRFDFRPIPQARIGEQLRRILDAEKVGAEDDVIRRVARLAAGSMRDALSLLDKVLSFSTGDLTSAALDELLPPALDEFSYALVAELAAGDAGAALRRLDGALTGGETLERTCELLLEHVRKLMLVRVCGTDTDLLDVSEALRPRFVEQAAAYEPPVYVYMLTLLEDLRRAVRSSGSGRALAEAALVRLAMASQFTDIRALLSGQARVEGAAEGVAASGRVSASAEKKNPADLRLSSDAGPARTGSRSTVGPVAHASLRQTSLVAPSEAVAKSAATPAATPGRPDRPATAAAPLEPRPSSARPPDGIRRPPGSGGHSTTVSPDRKEPWRDRVLKDDLVRETMARFEAHVSDIILASERGAAGIVEPPSDAPPPTEEEAPLFDQSHDVEEQD
ncbi:MAG: hypothetical protein FLDDKLPJ_01518 [Phycisphaerae bacterium]|nr:hypothetical protein [Phycisphaerae bacterium]